LRTRLRTKLKAPFKYRTDLVRKSKSFLHNHFNGNPKNSINTSSMSIYIILRKINSPEEIKKVKNYIINKLNKLEFEGFPIVVLSN